MTIHQGFALTAVLLAGAAFIGMILGGVLRRSSACEATLEIRGNSTDVMRSLSSCNIHICTMCRDQVTVVLTADPVVAAQIAEMATALGCEVNL